MKKEKACGAYILSLLLFGSNGIVAGKIALPSGEIVFWRTLIGGLFLLALFLGRGKRFCFYQHPKDALFVFLSGFFMGLSWIFLYLAYELIGVSLASLAYYCAPILVLLLSPLLFGEKLEFWSLGGILLVFLGILLTNGAVYGTVNRFGLLCGAGSALAHAGMVICSKKARKVQSMENALLQLLCSFFTVALYLLAKRDLTLSFPVEDTGWILLLGFVNTGLGCYLYFASLGHLPVSSVSVLGYLEPLSAVLLAALLLHERMRPLQWFGAALIIGGALLSELRTKNTGCRK